MKTFYRLLLLIVFIFIPSLILAEKVEFKGLSPSSKNGQLTLHANLTKPDGDGPFPAVIMMHGCDGEKPYFDPWEARIREWGFVVLRVDSLSPRNDTTFCDKGFMAIERAQDAYDAKAYLAQHSFVDKRKISLIGWSHGGKAVLYAVDDNIRIKERGLPFQCAVAIYPFCNNIHSLNAPLLVLTGEKDDWCPSWMCENFIHDNMSQHEVKIKIYEDALHGFDLEGVDKIFLGHKLKYNPEIAEDAILKVKRFFIKYLK